MTTRTTRSRLSSICRGSSVETGGSGNRTTLVAVGCQFDNSRHRRASSRQWGRGELGTPRPRRSASWSPRTSCCCEKRSAISWGPNPASNWSRRRQTPSRRPRRAAGCIPMWPCSTSVSPAVGGPAPRATSAAPRRGTRIVALAVGAEGAGLVDMVRSGATGYVESGADEEIVDAIRRAARGQSSLAAELLAGLVSTAQPADDDHRARRPIASGGSRGGGAAAHRRGDPRRLDPGDDRGEHAAADPPPRTERRDAAQPLQ